MGKKSMSMGLAVAVVVIALVAFYFHQQTGKTLKRLQAEGFVIDESIPSNPRLVIDKTRQRVAVIYANRYEDFSFAQIESVETRVVSGGSNEKTSREIIIRLKDHPNDRIAVKGRELQPTDQWVATLNALNQQ